MTLRFKWEWEPAPEVRLPELAATWCRLSIDLDGTPVTLVERRDGSGGPRQGLYVSAYPLAEFLAINWWRLNAASHLPDDRGVRLVETGAGFAWPDLTLRTDRGLMWATLRQRDKAPEHVRFLTQTATVFEADAALHAIAEFVDETVRRLEDSGVAGTLLQEEWAAIQQADHEERDYCLVAAAWGQDPYDMPADVERRLLEVGEQIGDAALLADLSRAVPRHGLGDSAGWLHNAAGALEPRVVDLPALGALDWSSTAGVAPWRVGYERARRLRSLLDFEPTRTMRVEQLLPVHQTGSDAPPNIDGLISVEGPTLAVVVGAGVASPAKRFAAARAIGRHSLTPTPRLSLLTRATTYTERAERAFAAELLAPAQGISAILGGDFSDDSVRRAAAHFRVSSTLIQHQIENQVAA